MTNDTVRESTPDTRRKKPEFHATRRLLNLLADVGPTFTPDPSELTTLERPTTCSTCWCRSEIVGTTSCCGATWPGCEWYPSGRELEVLPIELTIGARQARPVAIWAPNRQETPLRTLSARDRFTMKLRGEL